MSTETVTQPPDARGTKRPRVVMDTEEANECLEKMYNDAQQKMREHDAEEDELKRRIGCIEEAIKAHGRKYLRNHERDEAEEETIVDLLETRDREKDKLRKVEAQILHANAVMFGARRMQEDLRAPKATQDTPNKRPAPDPTDEPAWVRVHRFVSYNGVDICKRYNVGTCVAVQCPNAEAHVCTRCGTGRHTALECSVQPTLPAAQVAWIKAMRPCDRKNI